MGINQDREYAIRRARTALIEALCCVDRGELHEAVVGCALGMVFLKPVTDGDRVYELAKQLMAERKVNPG